MKAWRWIPGYEGRYDISDEGVIRSYILRQRNPIVCSSPQRTMVQTANRKGYLLVRLRDGVKTKAFQVHRLVLMAFRGPCPSGCEACHNDGNPTHNNLANLRWDTRKANKRDMLLHGTLVRGEQVVGSKLTASEIRVIRSLAANHSQADIAIRFDITQSNVSRILNGHTWKHVG